MAFPRFSIVHPSSCCCLRDTIINTKSKQDRRDQTSLLSGTHRNAPVLFLRMHMSNQRSVREVAFLLT